jgi:hypothetical protein
MALLQRRRRGDMENLNRPQETSDRALSNTFKPEAGESAPLVERDMESKRGCTDRIDLSRPFVELINERHIEKPGLRLKSDLKQVNVALVSYAHAIGTNLENLSVLHVCADSTRPHPNLIKHIDSMEKDKKYLGQNISRLRKLIRNLPWPGGAKRVEEPEPVILEECLPPYLQEVWFLLDRINGSRTVGKTKNERKQHRSTLPLTPRGLAVGLALLRVSNTYNILDVRALLEDGASLIFSTIRTDNPRKSWHNLCSAFVVFRAKVRAHLGYVVEKKPKISLSLEELPEPLKSQVLTYIERARHGFKSDWEIIKLAKTRYKLDIGLHSEVTIKSYLKRVLFGLGYISREMSIQVADIRELLKLQLREVEVDGILISEQYNPLVDCCRNRALGVASDRKDPEFDSTDFSLFINGVAAIAAFNGFLQLRKQFVSAYKVRLDEESKQKRKKLKKETFDRPWLNEQIQRLKLEFHQIVNEGSYKNKPNGSLSPEARRDLNLCLFYVALLALRFLGVRQQSIRDCILGKNLIFAANKSITFLWSITKNRKGITHELNIKDHVDTHRDLIEGIWIFYKKIYPYISGISNSDHSYSVIEELRRRVAGQFFLYCAPDGLCTKFDDEGRFYQWFIRQAHQFLDIKRKPISISINPHFLRAMFGDWLRFDLGFSKEHAAEMAADSEEVFESEYVTHPDIFNATDRWTKKNQEIRASKESEKEKIREALQAEVIQGYKSEMATMQETMRNMTEALKNLTDRT